MTSDPSMDYFEEYREKIKEVAGIREQIADLQSEVQCKKSLINSLSNEIESMRRIITVMIDHGMDPVEAKLRTDAEDRRADLWQDLMASRATTTTVTGATGSIGSMSVSDLTWPGLTTTVYPTVITNPGAINAIGSMRSP